MKTLAELRAAHDPPMTQRDLAKALGVTPGAVANWETGERTPSLAMAKRIAQLFGVAVEEIAFVGIATAEHEQAAAAGG
ncbi:MAG: helix-turn-helix transcriptional regulator [Bacillota bacterium]